MLEKLLDLLGVDQQAHHRERLMNIILLLIIVTTMGFLMVYIIWMPFYPAIIVHVIYLLLNLRFLYDLRRGHIFYIKYAIVFSFLIQLTLAVFLWFPMTTNYNLYYLLVPLVVYALVDYGDKIDRRVAHVFAVIPSIFFLLSQFLDIDYYLYNTSQQAEDIISIMTVTSVLISFVLLFLQYAKDQYKYQKELERLANTDALTNINNRRVLYNEGIIEFGLARKYNHGLTLLLMDIDDFKQVNDVYGHPVGDQLLVKLTETIMSNIRKEDTFVRYGGEEFAILIRRTSYEDSMPLAKKLLRVIQEEIYEIDDYKLMITVSFGLAQYSNNFESFDSMMSAADKALYRAKKLGKNRIEVV